MEDIFRFLHENSVDGVEFLPDQMMHGAPHPTDETIEQWEGWFKKYQIKPVIADVFLNTNLYDNRELTKKECVELLVEEIKLAHRLGMNMIRLVSMTPAFVLESLLPYCEKYNVKVALEIHAGLSFDKQKTKDYDGYVATEYEGNRWTLPGHPIVEKQEAIAHQKYIRDCLKEIQG